MKQSRRDRAFSTVGLACALVPLCVLIWLVLHAGNAARGLPFSELMAGPESGAGLLPALLGSLGLIGIATVLALPSGVAAAIYLEEFSEEGVGARILEANAVALAAVPSVLWGVFGAWVWVRTLALGESIVSGGLTLALLMSPTVMVTARESLRRVPDGVREAATALGANRWQALRRVVLPTALPGVFTGVVLSVSRAMGEAAPLLLVGALVYVHSGSTKGSYTALPVQLYGWLTDVSDKLAPHAGAGVLVLLVATVGLNATVIWRRARCEEGQ